MFDKMSKREQILAKIVLLTLPVTLIFVFGYWVYGSYNKKRVAISGLKSRIRDEDLRKDEIRNAGFRRDWYREISLPSDVPVSQTNYKFLLTKMVEKKLQKNGTIKIGKKAQPIKFRGGNTVFDQLSFTVSAKDTTLDKLVDFLYDFRSRKILHRISDLTINPVDSGKGERTGRMGVTLKIQAVALVDAPEKRQFAEDVRVLEHPVEKYKDSICFRDIFGMPNNAPTISTGTSHEFKEGERTDIAVKASDADGDQLTWEILSRDSEFAVLKMSKSGSNGIRLSGPAFPPNSRHKIKVKVTDNGCPPKSAIKEFVVRYEKKKEQKVEVVDNTPPPPPPFQHAHGARITGYTQDGDGMQVHIYVGTKDIMHSVSIGDSFELDGFKWTVKAIDMDKESVTIARDDEEFVYTSNDKSLFRPLPKKVANKKGSGDNEKSKPRFGRSKTEATSKSGDNDSK